MPPVPGSLLTALAVAAAVGAQTPEWARPNVVEPERFGLEPLYDGSRIVGLRSRESGTGLALVFKNPVLDFAVGAYSDDSFVVLAGGVRDSLDVYRWDPETGAIERFETRGGARLPDRSFGDGLGSWPLREGPHLCVFAYEADGKVQVRAWGSDRVLAARTLPQSVDGFSIRVEQRRQLVHVDFSGADSARPLSFLHPLAPRLVFPGLEGRVVTFPASRSGETSKFELFLKNVGARPLRADLRVQGVGFGFAPNQPSPGSLELLPDERTRRELWLVADAPGERTGQLVIESTVPSVRGVLMLRGQAGEPEQATAATADKEVEKPESPGVIPAIPLQPSRPVPLEPLTRDDLVDVGIERAVPAEVEVRGQLQQSRRRPRRDGAELRVRVRNGDVSAESEPGTDGRFEIRIGAAAGDRLSLSLVDRWTPSPVELELDAVAPALLLDGREVAVCGARLAPFLLAACADEALRRPLADWRGHTDVRGISRIPIRLLGRGRTPLFLLLVVEGADGEPRRSEPLRVVPDPPGR